MNTSKISVSIVLPVFNEEGCIRDVIWELLGTCASFDDLEIIAVNDGSTDSTPTVLKDIADTDRRVRMLDLGRNCGQSAAMWAGIRAARGEIVAFMDSDGQNVPSDIPRCIAELENSDVCCGIRTGRKDSVSKRIGSRLANAVRRLILHDGIADTGCPVKAFRAEYIKDLQYWDGMHRFLPALAAMRGARIMQIPVSHRPRTTGKSKYTNFGRLKKTVRDMFGVKWLKARTKIINVTEYTGEAK